jgi:gamma-glutamyl-gamma-aminobutyrate hydrolase PuuD
LLTHTVGNLKIGLSQRVLYHNGRAYDSTEHRWYQYLKNHTLVPVANRLDQDFEQLADKLDAFVITGGDDSAIRRTTELRLAGFMLQQHKPILGVCHGCFLLTDILGGKVDEIDGHAGIDHVVHYASGSHVVNSYHNLAVTRLHDTGVCLVTDAAGNCEAWIDGRIAGVVWHPERMDTPWLPVEISNLIQI